VKGYLIDTNMVNFWYNDQLPEHANVALHVDALDPDDLMFVSAVTIGEIGFGHAITTAPDPTKQAELRAFLEDQFPDPLPITASTQPFYAAIRAHIFRTFPPQGRRQRRPEQCFDKVHATTLGIDENDLWIASQAVEHKLILVTHDKMARIRETLQDVLLIEDWTDPV
jgi:tRNA(fMet)-specific endonuclease VapC